MCFWNHSSKKKSQTFCFSVCRDQTLAEYLHRLFCRAPQPFIVTPLACLGNIGEGRCLCKYLRTTQPALPYDCLANATMPPENWSGFFSQRPIWNAPSQPPTWIAGPPKKVQCVALHRAKQQNMFACSAYKFMDAWCRVWMKQALRAFWVIDNINLWLRNVFIQECPALVPKCGFYVSL